MELVGDVLKTVLDFVPTRSKVHGARGVCREWRQRAGESEWHVVERDVRKPLQAVGWVAELNVRSLRCERPVPTEALLHTFASHGVGVPEVRVAITPPAAWQHLTAPCFLNTLQKLSVQEFTPPCPDAEHPPLFSRLESLSASAVPTAAAWNCVPGGGVLRSLSLSHVSDAALAAHVAPKLTEATSLSLASCDDVGAKGFLAVARHARNLESLDLASTHVTPGLLASILENNPNLRSLSLQDCDLLNHPDETAVVESRENKEGSAHHDPQARRVANFFAELKSVTKKTQAHVPTTYKDDKQDKEEGAAPTEDEERAARRLLGVGTLLSRHRNLRSLQLSGVGLLDDAGLRLLLTGLRQLESFRISKNREVTDLAFCSAEGHSLLPPSLKTIGLGSCIQLTDSTLSEVAKLPQLQQLSISNCRNMSAEGLQHVLESCPTLKRIYAFTVGTTRNPLGYLTKPPALVTDSVLQAAWRCLPNIEEFAASSQDITAAAFPLNITVPSLRSLQLDFCVSREDTYAPLFRTFPYLTKLSLQGSVPVPRNDLKQLLTSLPGLHFLRICVTSASDVLLHLQKPAARSLDHLDLEYSGPPEHFNPVAWFDVVNISKKLYINQFLGNVAQEHLHRELDDEAL